MSTIDAGPSENGRGSDAWLESWTHLRVDRRSAGHCRVTFHHPPANAMTATTVAELTELVDLIEQDDDLNVVVFDSANRDVFLGGEDARPDPAGIAAVGAGRTGGPAWDDVLARLSGAPAVSIAAIRGRARGAGSEFALACDLRFASRENMLLGWPGAGMGLAPGRRPTARLAAVVGGGRALELLLLGDDLDGPRAERYGCVDRLIADERLDAEVEAIAARLARVDHAAIARTKARVTGVAVA
jgi:enoyl-CoA hydratase/carnithine racemase